MANGRRIGNDFENMTCRLISKWLEPKRFAFYLTCPLADLPVRRQSTALMPTTGHWRGAGDLLVAWNTSLPFTVECKKKEGWTLDGFLNGSDKKLADWWFQADQQSSSVDGIPLLVFTRNQAPIYAALNLFRCGEDFMDEIGEGGYPYAVVTVRDERLLLCRLPDLIQVPIAKVVRRK